MYSEHSCLSSDFKMCLILENMSVIQTKVKTDQICNFSLLYMVVNVLLQTGVALKAISVHFKIF